MRHWCVNFVVVVILLAGCQRDDPVASAKRRLEMIKKASPSDLYAICDAGRRVEEAYLQAQDQKGYEAAKLSADLDCHTAEIQRHLGA